MRYFQLFVFLAVLVDVHGLGCCRRFYRKMKALTFNTGLTGIVEIKNPGHQTSRDDRRTAIINAIRGEDADIVCLQEIMTGKDIEAFVNGLQDVYPHSHSSLHRTDGTLPSQSGSIGGRLEWWREMYGLHSEPDTGPRTIITNCALSSPLGTMNTNGLLMLSKRQFTSRQMIDYHPNIPELFVRGYLEAKIEDTITAVCTHLIPYGPGTNPEPLMRLTFATSELQNAYEIGMLISQFGDVNPAVLMGDFNVNGRSTPAGSGYDQFQRLISVFKTDVSNKCSFCRSPVNVYNGNTAFDKVIDFVFGNGVRIFNTQRVFTTDEVSIPDRGQRVPLSDHFGITGVVHALSQKGNCN